MFIGPVDIELTADANLKADTVVCTGGIPAFGCVARAWTLPALMPMCQKVAVPIVGGEPCGWCRGYVG